MAERLLAAASVIWLAALVFASEWVFPVCVFICHQRPDRSFFVHGNQMAVCARCTGLYTGAALAAPVAFAAVSAIARSRARWLLLIASLPTAITWTLEAIGLMPFSNPARFVAALPLGFAAALLVLTTLRQAAPSRRA